MKRVQHWRIETIKQFIELTDKNCIAPQQNEKEIKNRNFNGHKV